MPRATSGVSSIFISLGLLFAILFRILIGLVRGDEALTLGVLKVFKVLRVFRERGFFEVGGGGMRG